MNKKPWIVVTVFVLLLACMGQLKISQYPNTKTAAETDLLILATPGVTNWNITVSDFRSNVIAYGGGDTYYISQSYITNLYVTTNISYFQFVTNLVSISNSFYVTYATNLYVTTNITFIEWVTNLYTEIANVKNLYVSTNYTTNLYVTTNYVTYNYVTNQTVYQTNIVNQTITTNLTVYETNINNVSITTNLYVTQNSYISNLFTTNLYTSNLYATNLYVSNAYVTNLYATNIYVTNLYVQNPFMGLQQLTNVAITNTAAGDVLQWNNTMKLWTNSPPASTNTIYYTSLSVTNIAYQTNTVIDCSLAQNVYWMTNAMANHMYIQLTNMTPPQSISVIVQGAAAYTNFSIYVFGNAGNTVNWLSLTNGQPAVTITSNQTMMLDFTVVTSSTSTNVMAAWKETFK